jgi:predicted alpha-1,6-mannanase (GH76 family)
MKQIVSLCLLLSLILTSFAGCAGNGGTRSETENTAAETTAPAETEAVTEEVADEALRQAETVFDAFIAQYYDKGKFKDAHFWDNAEIFETVIDAYEVTRDEKYRAYIDEISAATIGQHGKKWTWNEYNDDIMWLCIAYTRAYLLTGEADYLKHAKTNFDSVWTRAYSDDLGGGLWWRTDNKSKNSCVCGPGAIAACLLGKATGNDKYYDKAKQVLDWQIENLYQSGSGRVFDAISINGEINKWASTYNQGTFIGACMLLYEHTGDEIYQKHAGKAATYAMKSMYSYKVMNNETDGGDLIGFKGILTRWISRYAVSVNNQEIFDWLNLNAETAWKNRNSKNLIWTAWGEKTSNKIAGYDVFGMSTAVALMFNRLLERELTQ